MVLMREGTHSDEVCILFCKFAILTREHDGIHDVLLHLTAKILSSEMMMYVIHIEMVDNIRVEQVETVAGGINIQIELQAFEIMCDCPPAR